VEALKRLEPSQELLITFRRRRGPSTRAEFKDNPAKPVLTGDSWTNDVARRPGLLPLHRPAGDARSNCEEPGAEKIVEEPVPDESHRRVVGDPGSGRCRNRKDGPRKRFRNGADQLEGPSSEYVKGIVSPTEPKLPQYRPGDEICWRLVVEIRLEQFYAGTPVVSGLHPADETYVQGSAVKGPRKHGPKRPSTKSRRRRSARMDRRQPGEGSVESKTALRMALRTKVDTSSEADPGKSPGT